MASNSETGHAVNSSNFIEKVNVVKRYSDYKPSNALIMIEALNPIRETLLSAVDLVSSTYNAFSTAVTNRSVGYDKMDKYIARIMGILKSSSVGAADMKIAESLVKKYRSVRVSEVPETPTSGTETKTISKSEQGYIKKLSHFREFIVLLKGVAKYAPNEADLKVTALETFATSVDNLNTDRNKKEGEWKGAIDARNKLLYEGETSAHALSSLMLAYAKGAFGTSSLIYKELMQYPVRTYKR
jgi:hypothetical protein